MSYNWGPHYIVPSGVRKSYSGAIQLREELQEDLLEKELEELGFKGPVVRIVNPWYYRKKNTETWIKIGESTDKAQNFPIRWDTARLENGQYEILGLMHAFVRQNGDEVAIARENVVEVTVEN
jgi:small-conductance mechanosensitive channel